MLLFKEVMVDSLKEIQYRSDKRIRSTIHLRKWDAAVMKSMGKTESYVRKYGYY